MKFLERFKATEFCKRLMQLAAIYDVGIELVGHDINDADNELGIDEIGFVVSKRIIFVLVTNKSCKISKENFENLSLDDAGYFFNELFSELSLKVLAHIIEQEESK